MSVRVAKETMLALLCSALFGCGCCGRAVPEATLVQPTQTPDWRVRLATGEAVMFYDTQCEPPCWHGITPGTSSEEDVVRVLEQLDAEGELGYHRTPGSTTYHIAGSVGAVEIKVEDGRVKYIWSYYLANYRVKHIVERLGEPRAVVPRDVMPGTGQSCEELEPLPEKVEGQPDADPTGSFFLLYPSKGVTYGVTRYYYGYVCPEMQTSAFLYYEPISLDEALNKYSSLLFGLSNFDSEDLVEWHGYGDGY